jgi:hypothetical protein
LLLLSVVLATLLAACGNGALKGPEVDVAVATTATSADRPTISGAVTSTMKRNGSSTSTDGPTTSGAVTSTMAGNESPMVNGRPAPTATTTTTTQRPKPPPPDEDFDWGLPIGDATVSLNEDVLYRMVQPGECGDAQDYLDELWDTLRSPRAVLLYQAAIDFCTDNAARARLRYQQASAYG